MVSSFFLRLYLLLLVPSLQLLPCACWPIAPSTVPPLPISITLPGSCPVSGYPVSPGYGISLPLVLRHLGSSDPPYPTSSLDPSMLTSCVHPSVQASHTPLHVVLPSVLLYTGPIVCVRTPLAAYALSMLYMSPVSIILDILEPRPLDLSIPRSIDPRSIHPSIHPSLDLSIHDLSISPP